jgi:RNA polymerase sigma-70 factor, ECF subfamily
MKEIVPSHVTFGWSEADAIRRAQGGDAAAFEYLYKLHSKRLYNVCLRMLKNTAEAENLMQQVFLRLFRKIGTFRGDAEFSTWRHRVTVNAVLMHLRRKKPAEVIAESWDPTDTNGNDPSELGSCDTSMLRVIDRLNLIRAICQLPAGCQRLRYYGRYLGRSLRVECQTCSRSGGGKEGRRARTLAPEQS